MNTYTKLLHENWKFHYGSSPDAWQKSFDDTSWSDVTVPHDWSVTMPFSRECSSGTGYLPGGCGWYRTSFKLPAEYEGKRVCVVFDGVYKNSQVWCNSHYKGKYPYGYTTFCYDLTDEIHFGEQENTLCVKVMHEDLSDSRWFTGSGITRKVQIIIMEQVHPAFQGVFFTTPKVSKDSATVEIFNEIKNDSPQAAAVTVVSTLSCEGMKPITFTVQTAPHEMLQPGETRTLITKGTVPDPHLWSIDDPHLYHLETALELSGSAAQTSSPISTIADHCLVGIRSFAFHPERGFQLNGIPMKLKGVCVHHDAGALGAAVPAAVWARRLIKLREMGCNAIRMSHNPHSPELYSLCDSMGFLVIDEAFDEWEGCKNKWSTGHNVYPPKHQGYAEEFPQWHEQDLRAMIRRDRNHPSVILWSIGNEIDYPNDPYCHPLFQSMTGNNDANKPEAERMYNPNRPNAERLTVIANELARIVKETDGTRPVTAAAAFPELSAQIGFLDPLEVVGYNYKEHLYEQDHGRFPEKPFMGSENGHSYEAWRAVIDHDYISGQFLWTGIDYLGEAHGWPIHGSSAGLLTTAGFEKTDYFRRKSYWRADPVLELAAARKEQPDPSLRKRWNPMLRSWNFAEGDLVTIHCYTNCDSASVSLYCNEKDMGEGTFDTQLGALTWTIPYEAGTLKAVACIGSSADANTDTVCETSKTHTTLTTVLNTTKAPTQITLKQWKPDAKTRAAICELENNTSEITSEYVSLRKIEQIEIIITDENGQPVPGDCSPVFIDIEGDAALLAIDNGDLSDNRDLWSNWCHIYDGKAIAYVAKSSTDASVTVKAYSDYLKPAYLSL